MAMISQPFEYFRWLFLSYTYCDNIWKQRQHSLSAVGLESMERTTMEDAMSA